MNDSEGILYFEPTFGLANRLRAMASVLKLSQNLNKKLVIIWVNNFELNCPFQELFQPLPGVLFRDKPYLWQFTKNSEQNNFGYRFVVYAINKLLGFDFCTKELNNDFFYRKDGGGIDDVVKKYKNIYVQTCSDFLNDDRFLQQFKPVAELQTQIEQRSADFSNYTVGLHIRRTDHKDAIMKSSLELFIQHIDAELVLRPNTLFYLSTDEPETEVRLKELYGDKLLLFPKNFSRNSIQGIKDAVVDLFCLSRTQKIIGSYNSSFSDIAARLGQVELQVVA
ncbi:hypothetical protein [Hymenobacter psoromatis]|uniref:hypothetical protein n=1 Tax=Hymenobacter psoromatis TaxID=1484116 RepID=UPI001CBFF794|nr:hypothetical protein [Hymenobacter psoromatis]